MTRISGRLDRVRLGPADWGGLCSFALVMLTLAASTLYQVHSLAHSNGRRLAAVDAELSAIKQNIALLQTDIRAIAKGARP